MCYHVAHGEHRGARAPAGTPSRWLARVRAGETFVVTDRGRPVARLSPFEEPAGYDRLVAEGKIAPGSGRSLAEMLTALDADIPPDQGPSVTEALLELRSGER